MTVKEVLEEIKSEGENKYNRFSKKNFDKLMKAIVNDVEFSEKVAQVKGGELVDEIPVMVTKNFRKFLRHIVEKAGVDKAESQVVMEESFTIDNVDGLYDFFTAALYEYIAAGNKFDMPKTKDFQGSLYMKSNPKASKKTKGRNPQTGEDLGEFEQSNEAYHSLAVSSPCPKWLKSRKKL
mgnify:FL=1|nr:MAG TPA: integrase [Caudoviricetes sp.]